MQSSSNKTIPKIFGVVSFISILSALIIIAKTPLANHYEISIYDVYPWYFWFCLVLPMIMPFFLLILNEKCKPDAHTYIVFAGALFSLVVLLSIPIFRGYPFYGAGDIYSHFSMIKHILLVGHIGSNFYPVTHILFCVVSTVLHCAPETISLYMRQFFVLFYVISIFLLSRSLKCSTRESLFVTFFAILPSFGYWLTVEYIMPSTESFFMLPITLYIMIRSRTSNNQLSYSVILIPLLVLFPFFHPEAVIFLFVTLIVFAFVFKMGEKPNGAITNRESGTVKKDMFAPLLILIAAFFTWFSTMAVFAGTVKSVYNAFILGISSDIPPLQSIMGGFKIGILDVLELIIRTYGPALIYLTFGGCISIFAVVNFILKKRFAFRDLVLSSCLFSLMFLNILFLFRGTAVGFHIYRQLKYSIFISTILVGIYFAKRFSWKNKTLTNSIVNSILIAIVIMTSILALYDTYSSPQTDGINYQPTNSDISGMDFFFKYRNENYSILEPCVRAYQTRFGDYILGFETIKPTVRWGYSLDVTPPPHFGYATNNTLGSFYASSQYLLIYPPSTNFYPTLWPSYRNLWRYSPDDFKQLFMDSTVDHTYSNGALEIFIINSHIE